MATQPNSNQRLDRIEEKIDKLADAVVAIARTEEKLANLQSEHNKNYDRMNKFSEKLDAIDESCKDNARAVGVITKLFWVAVVAIIGTSTTVLMTPTHGEQYNHTEEATK